MIFQFWNNISNVSSFVENDFLLKGGSSFPEISLSGAYHREWMESLGNKINIEMGREKQGKEIMTIWLKPLHIFHSYFTFETFYILHWIDRVVSMLGIKKTLCK